MRLVPFDSLFFFESAISSVIQQSDRANYKTAMSNKMWPNHFLNKPVSFELLNDRETD